MNELKDENNADIPSCLSYRDSLNIFLFGAHFDFEGDDQDYEGGDYEESTTTTSTDNGNQNDDQDFFEGVSLEDL